MGDALADEKVGIAFGNKLAGSDGIHVSATAETIGEEQDNTTLSEKIKKVWALILTSKWSLNFRTE